MGKGAVLTLIWDLPLYNSKSWMIPRGRRVGYPALNRFHGGWENMALVHYEGSHWIVTCCLQVRLILSLCARRFTIDLAKQRNKRVHGDTGMPSSWKTRRTSLCLKAILSECDTTATTLFVSVPTCCSKGWNYFDRLWPLWEWAVPRCGLCGFGRNDVVEERGRPSSIDQSPI